MNKKKLKMWEEIEEIEYTEIRLKVPKPIIEFLKIATGENVEEYLECRIVDAVRADLDAEIFFDSPNLIKRFDLDIIISTK